MSRHTRPCFLLLSGLFCALAACERFDSQTQAPQPRRLVALAEPTQELATVIKDVKLNVSLEKGEAHVLSFGQPLEVDKEYTLEITFEGQQPATLTSRRQGPTLRRLKAIPGLQLTGQTQHMLRPSKPDQAVEVRAQRGPCKLLRAVLRQWGSRGFSLATPQEKLVFHDVDIYGDHRAAVQLPLGEQWQVDVDVPADARWLMFDVAPFEPDLRPNMDLLLPEDWHVVVEASELPPTEENNQAAAPTTANVTRLYDASVPKSIEAWTPLRLDARGLAGRRVRLSIASRQARRTDPRPSGSPAVELAISLPAWACTEGPRRPNLVIISLDTTRPDHLGCYGYPRNTTPRLDSFAEDAVLFRQATSTSAYTLPAHATLFSGQYPTTHGAEHPAHALSATRTPLLAVLLRDAGYATRGFTGGGYLDADFGFARGFRAYSDNDPILDLEGKTADRFDSNTQERRYLRARKKQHWQSALEWVEQNQELPFFLFLHTFAVHDYRPRPALRSLFGKPPTGEDWVQPLRTLPEQLETPYTKEEVRQLIDLYDAALREADSHLGQLFETLDRLSLTDDTIVVITSDHGEDFGEHVIRNTPIVGHGHGLWQNQLEIPLLIRAPGLAAGQVNQRVSLVDVAPTLIDLLGLPVHPAMQGQSLLPIMKGEAGTPSPVLAELHSNHRFARAYLRGQLKLVTGDPAAAVKHPEPKQTQLYDLRNDPLEKQDLEQQKQQTARSLRLEHDALVRQLSAERQGDDKEAVLSEETRTRLVELGYVDGD